MDDFLALVRQLAKEKRIAGFIKPEGQFKGEIKDVYVRRIV